MAKSQIEISKKPRNEAPSLLPLETRIILTVPIETSVIRAKKMNSGIIK
jgi:hypothetical protein